MNPYTRRRERLEQDLAKNYELLREYERQLLLTSDTLEKARGRWRNTCG